MNIVIERHGRVAVVRLNRPQARNALNSELMREMVSATQALDRDAGIGCIVIAGAETYFAAGADIREMHQKSYLQMVQDDFFAGWDAFAAVRTPKIAAVAGYAFGGGCELAMMCDTIYAGESARFGQPEITLGVMPGMGGSQRLTKLVGKSLAMDMILTGRQIDAAEAQRSGLVARVIPDARLMAEALEAAQRIASFSNYQLGGSLGGPLVRNRAFVFANVESVRQSIPSGYMIGLGLLRRACVAAMVYI